MLARQAHAVGGRRGTYAEVGGRMRRSAGRGKRIEVAAIQQLNFAA